MSTPRLVSVEGMSLDRGMLRAVVNAQLNPLSLSPSVLLLPGVGLYEDTGGSTPATADGANVELWKDQSGNGNDLSQSNSGNAPIYDAYFSNKGGPQSQDWIPRFLMNTSGPTLSMTDFTVIVTLDTLSLCAAFSNQGNLTEEIGLFSIGAGSNVIFAYLQSGPSGSVVLALVVTGQSTQATTAPPTYGPMVITFIGNGSTLVMRLNGQQIYSGTNGSGNMVGTGVGAAIFGGQAYYPAHASYSFYAAFPTVLTTAQIQGVEAYARASATSTFNPSANAFVFLGDSLTVGYYSSTVTGSYPGQLFNSLSTSRRNSAIRAVGGTQFSEPYGSVEPWYVDSFFNANRPNNVLFLWLGTNDIDNSYAGGSALPSGLTYTNAAGLVAAIKAYCAARTALGWKVILLNILPRNSQNSNFETDRQTVNSSLRGDFGTTYATNVLTGASYATALIDLGSDTTIGAAGDDTNTTYYASDATHLINAGYAIVAGYAKTALGILDIS